MPDSPKGKISNAQCLPEYVILLYVSDLFLMGPFILFLLLAIDVGNAKLKKGKARGQVAVTAKPLCVKPGWCVDRNCCRRSPKSRNRKVILDS